LKVRLVLVTLVLLFGGRGISGLGSHHPQIDVIDFLTDRKTAIIRWF